MSATVPDNTKSVKKKRPAWQPRAFKPGQSGNPGGRPKALIEVIELARAHTPEAIITLAEIMTTDGAAPAARVAAATVLLERGWGKPVQPIDAQVDMRATWVIRAPLPVESAKEWLKVYAPEGDDDAVIQIESP